MKKFYLLLIGALFLATTAEAQDVIVRKDGTTVLAKVEKVGTSEIEYRKWGNIEGPIYSAAIADIISINYENGTRDTFESAPATEVASATTSTSVSTTTSATTSAPKSNWYRDQKWFTMNPELFGVRMSLEGEGYLGAVSSAITAWNLGRFFHAGFGLEVYSTAYDDKFMVNVFGDVCWYVFGKKKFTPYYDLRFGLSSIGGIYFREAMGLAIGNCTLSAGIAFVGMIDDDVPAWDLAFGIHF